MARNLARSSSGCDSSSASASTRALKSCQDSSRLKYRSSGRDWTAVGAAEVTAGGAEGSARNSCAGLLAEPPRVALVGTWLRKVFEAAGGAAFLARVPFLAAAAGVVFF